jgi:WD40 repeat protein
MRPELLPLAACGLLATGLGAAAQALDSLGDPLPEGAVQRLGTLRLCYTGSVGGLAYLPDGRALVLHGGYVEIWNTSKQEREAQVKVSESALACVQLRSDGRALLLADGAGKVREWDLATQQELRSWDTGIGGLKSAYYSPDGTRMLTAGGTPPIIREWDLASGEQLIEIKSQMATTRCGAIYGPGGKTAILGGGYDHILEHYDLATGELLQKWYTVYETKCLSLSPDQTSVAAGVETHAAEWKLADYSLLHRYAHAPADGGRVFSVVHLRQTNQVLCGGRDGSIYRWDRQSGKQLSHWTPHQGPIYHLAVSPDERWVLSYGSGRVSETSIETGQPRAGWHRHGGSVEGVAFLPGGMVVSASSDATLRVWDIPSGKSVHTIGAARLGAYAIAAAPDAARVAAGCKDGVVREWSLLESKLLRELKGHLGYVRSVAYTHDGQRLLSTADDGAVCVWPAEGTEPVARLEGHRGGVLAVAVSADDRLAATGGRDGTVRIWDLGTYELRHTCEGHRGWVEAAVFVADTHHVLTTGRDGRILRWDADTGEQTAEIDQGGWTYALACSPDGSRAYSAEGGRSLICWDLTTGEKIAELTGHEGSVSAVAVSPDGTRIVTASRDGTLLVWKAPAS